MDAKTRTAVLVELLARNADARAAVVSWPLVRGAGAGPAAIADWSRCSGIPRGRLVPVAQMLFRHAVCLPDRTVDPEALKIVEHVAAATLRRLRG